MTVAMDSALQVISVYCTALWSKCRVMFLRYHQFADIITEQLFSVTEIIVLSYWNNYSDRKNTWEPGAFIFSNRDLFFSCRNVNNKVFLYGYNNWGWGDRIELQSLNTVQIQTLVIQSFCSRAPTLFSLIIPALPLSMVMVSHSYHLYHPLLW